MPCGIEAIVPAGASVALELLGHDGQHLVCASTERGLEAGGSIVIVLHSQKRAGYEIDCVLVSDNQGRPTRLRVQSVKRVKPRRRRPRIAVVEWAVIQHNGDEEFDVRVLNVSADGIAFISERSLSVGDAFTAMLNVDHCSFPVQGQVMHVSSRGFGRTQVGCQFTGISDRGRKILDRVADRAPADRRRIPAIEY
jgi:hypothetical protein